MRVYTGEEKEALPAPEAVEYGLGKERKGGKVGDNGRFIC
jgi:hypothetical protein